MKEAWPKDMLIGHPEENDGIEEYDNPMPGWFNIYFIGCCVAGVILFLNWHVFDSKTVEQFYEAERAAAIEKYGSFEPIYIEFDAARAERAASTFASTCSACHGQDGGGTNIGVSFLDEEWLHGDTIEDITNTIFFGISGTGMPAWGRLLGPETVADLASYVYQISGLSEGL